MKRDFQAGKSRAVLHWLSVALFALALALPTLLWVTVGAPEDGAQIEEKRELAKFPSRIRNKVVVELENWYRDHAPYRSEIIALKERATQPGERYYRERIHAAASALCAPDWYPCAPFQQGRAYLAPLVNSGVCYGRGDWLFYAMEGSLDYFQGRNPLTEAEMEAWRGACERLDEVCARRGIEMVILIAPNKEQVYPEYMPSWYVPEGEKREAAFAEYMRRNSGVTLLYPLRELEAAKGAGELYYRQDTHWNSLGACVGAAEVLGALDMPCPALADAGVAQIEKTGGDLSNFCGFATTYPDYAVDPWPQVSAQHDQIEGTTEAPIDRYTSDAASGRDMLLIGDSFRDALAPVLAESFAELTVFNRIDVESEALRRAWDDLDRGDVLLLVAVERYDADNMGAIARLAELFA